VTQIGSTATAITDATRSASPEHLKLRANWSDFEGARRRMGEERQCEQSHQHDDAEVLIRCLEDAA